MLPDIYRKNYKSVYLSIISPEKWMYTRLLPAFFSVLITRDL